MAHPQLRGPATRAWSVGPPRRNPVNRATLIAVLAALAVALLACSDDPADEEVETPEQASEDLADLAEAPDPAAFLTDGRGDPPAELVAEDLVIGDGAAGTPGSQLSLQYVGVRWSDGGRFDSSWLRGEPYRFELGSGRVISGWDQGIAGVGLGIGPMRVGGRRALTIPAHLAYGERGAGSDIGPGETLVFIIDLVHVEQ